MFLLEYILAIVSSLIRMTILMDEARTLWRSRTLVWGLTRREVSARHSGTVLGVIWPYLQPLLTIAAYYLVFDVVFSMRLGEGAPTHAVGAFLIVGALPWMAFCDAISRGMSSLLDAGGLLKKIRRRLFYLLHERS